MFWTMIVVALVLWGVGMLASVTFGGLIHVLPVAALAAVVFRRMAKPPNTEFGRWRAGRYTQR